MIITYSRLTIQYGANSTVEKYLDIVACLCTNNGSCGFDQTTAISSHYKLAACQCPDQYDGIRHKYHYNLALINAAFFH